MARPSSSGDEKRIAQDDLTRLAYLEALLDDVEGAIAAFDQDGRLIYVNEAKRRLMGFDHDDVPIGFELEAFYEGTTRKSLTGDVLRAEDHPVYRALRGESPRDIRQILERSPGDQRYLSIDAHPIALNGELIGAVSITRDVTNAREIEVRDEQYTRDLEHALRRSQTIADVVTEITDTTARLEVDSICSYAISRVCAEFDSLSGMLWLLDSRDYLHLRAECNHRRVELADEGYPLNEFVFAHEALDRNRPMVVDNDDLKAPEAIVQCMEGADSVLVIPMRIRGERIGIAYLCFKDATEIDESERLFASVWGRQCAQGIETARLFEQLETAHDRIIGVIEQMPQAVLIVDLQTETVSISNAATDRLWGLDVTDHLPVADLHMLTAEGSRLRGKHHPLIAHALAGKTVTGESLLVEQADGTQVDVVANHAPLLDAHQRIVGGVSVIQQRSDFVSMDRSRDEFLSLLGHEIRNPLTSLRGNLQLLERRVKKRDDEGAEEDVRRIETAVNDVDRIGDLVARMMDVSRVGLNRLDIVAEPFDAAELVREVVDSARMRDPEREVTLEAPESVPVEWDQDRVYQVLSNLLQNTDRYANGTEVNVCLTVHGDKVTITVRDHGPGVSPRIRRRLFKQYYRFDDGHDHDTLRDAGRGLGIGLYVSERLIRQHGGRLTVGDPNNGPGAVFTITLPRIAAVATQPQPQPVGD